ncbi:MAG: ABC transporter permease [bacterium]|nr:ABC transporter permease [bacterium]
MNSFSFQYWTRRKERPLVRLASFLAIGGIALAVLALSLGLSIISGFEKEYLKSVLSFNASLVLLKSGEIENQQEEEEKLKDYFQEKNLSALNNAITPFLYREGILVHKEMVKGIVMKGVDLKGMRQNSRIKINYEDGFSEKEREEGILVGKRLKENLKLNRGETVYFFLPQDRIDWRKKRLSPKDFHPFKVVGTFESGLYDYDAGFGFVPLPVAQKLLKSAGKISGFEVWIKDPVQALTVGDQMKKEWPFSYSIMTWRDLNQNLFQALNLQKLVFQILLGFLVLVASFNLTGVLVMKMLERRKEIAIFRSLGASLKDLEKIFFQEGVFLGSLGILGGTLLSFFLSYLIESQRFIRLAPEVYFISSVPAVWSWTTVLGTAGIGLLFIMSAVWISLTRLSRLNIVRVLSEG